MADGSGTVALPVEDDGQQPKKGGLWARVLEDEDYTNNLLQKKGSLAKLWKSVFTIAVYAAFIAAFNFMVLGDALDMSRRMEHHVRHHFDAPSSVGAARPIALVNSVDTFWNYVTNIVIPKIYGEDPSLWFIPGVVIPKMMPIDGQTRMVGIMQLRAVRVLPNVNCGVRSEYEGEFSECHGPWHPESEDTEEYGIPSRTFKYKENPGGTTYAGKAGDYGPGGFVETFGTNYTVSENLAQTLKTANWIDQATRAVFIEFTLYNGNNNIFTACRITFEITAGGSWEPNFDVEAVPQRYLVLDAYMIGTTGVMTLFVLFYIGTEITELCIERLGYFKDGWNILDWINLILVGLACTFAGLALAGSAELQIGVNEMAEPNTFTNLHRIATLVRTARDVNAINAVLIYVKIIKYACSIPYIEALLWTVKYSFRIFAAFVSVFFLSFFGFTLAYHIGFGGEVSDLDSLWSSFFFLLRSFVGSSSIVGIFNLSPLLGFALIALYIGGIIGVVMNFFSASMMQALVNAHERQDYMSRKGDSSAERLKEMFRDLSKQLWEQWGMQRKIRMYFPGLYARQRHAKKVEEAKKKMRVHQALEARRLMMERRPGGHHIDLTGQTPGEPGAHKRLPIADGNDTDSDRSDSGTKDLGPLRRGTIALRKCQKPGATKKEGDVMLQAIKCVSTGVMNRANNMRGLVLEEMGDSRQVIEGIADVVEVLVRRAGDLELLQRKFLGDEST